MLAIMFQAGLRSPMPAHEDRMTDYNDATAVIASHLRAAVEQEREACAEIVDNCAALNHRLAGEFGKNQVHSACSLHLEIAGELSGVASQIRSRTQQEGQAGNE